MTLVASPMNSLPIDEIKAEFIAALAQQQTIVLSAPPGAGKSTRLPLWLLQHPDYAERKIYLLQPRRVAVKAIACYLAEQLGEAVGQSVGYRLRNESKVSKQTRLEVLTEGILTQIIQQDPELSSCALVIFDEFHERSLHADLAFALARDVQQGLRDDLQLLLMSATLHSDELLAKLPDAVALSSEGRSFPVDVSYRPAKQLAKWRDHALNVLLEVVPQHQGSTLVFLPGVADIRFLAEQLSERLPADISIAPLYGDLTLAQQQQVIAPCRAGRRKLVLATNIAETSITIDGIDLVIDCGLEKVALYDSASLMNQLLQQQITRSSALQRAGRAGRLSAGHCIRLYSQEDFQRRPMQSSCEIHQADLLPVLIEVARWGVDALEALPFLDYPSSQKQQQAWLELQALNIVDGQHKLTRHGEQVAALACHPRLAHMLLTARAIENENNTVPSGATHLQSLACIAAAMLEERDFYRGEQAALDCRLDHRVLDLCHLAGKGMRAGENSLLQRIVQQAKSLARQLGITINFSGEQLPLALLGPLLGFAYPERIAKARASDGDFLCANGKGCRIQIQDSLADSTFIVAANVSQSRQTAMVRLAAALTQEQIHHFYGNSIVRQTRILFDDATGKVQAREQLQLGAILLSDASSQQPVTAAQIAGMWAEQVRSKGLAYLPWRDNDLALLARWRWLNAFVTEAALPEVAEQHLLASLDIWFMPFVADIRSLAQLAKLDLSQMLLSMLDYQQRQQLDKLAPAVYLGPTGRNCPIRYTEQRSPTVSLPMQEVYGLSETPCVAAVANQPGIALILELLSPAGRPCQITQDLAEFWRGSYKEVQKDMKARYPKHYWPDDPANAKATNKTKRHLS